MQIDTATTTFRDGKIDPNIHTESLRICSYTPRFQRMIRRIFQSHVIWVKFRGFVLMTCGRLPRLFPIKPPPPTKILIANVSVYSLVSCHFPRSMGHHARVLKKHKTAKLMEELCNPLLDIVTKTSTKDNASVKNATTEALS